MKTHTCFSVLLTAFATSMVSTLVGCSVDTELTPAPHETTPAPTETGDTKGKIEALGGSHVTFTTRVDFADAFTFNETRCASQGEDDVEVSLPAGEVQFSSCTLSLRKTARVQSIVRTRITQAATPKDPHVVVGGSWEVATRVDGSNVSLAMEQPRTGFDWTSDAMTLEITFESDEGTTSVASVALKPADLARLLVLKAPELEKTRVLVDNGKTQERFAREDANHLVVLRPGEDLRFLTPFKSSASAVRIDKLATHASVVFHPGSAASACFDSTMPMVTSTAADWTRAGMLPALPTLLEAKKTCASPAGTISGTTTIDLHMGAPMAADFTARLAPESLDKDVEIKLESSNGLVEALRVTNAASYSLLPLEGRLDFVCEGRDDVFSLSLPARTEISGTTTRFTNLERAGTTRWSRPEIKSALAAAMANDKCESGKFQILRAEVRESSIAPKDNAWAVVSLVNPLSI